MNERVRDIDLVIGRTYKFVFLPHDDVTDNEYLFMGIEGSKIAFMTNGGFVWYGFNPSTYCPRYWEVVKKRFKFGR